MGQTNYGLTDTPETPSSGYTGLFIKSTNEAYLITSAGTEIAIAQAGQYPEAIERASNTVIFDNDYVIGNAAARTGNILFDFTGAKIGAVTMMKHNDAAAFTIPVEADKIGGTYVASVDNYIYFNLVKKSATQEVLVTISQGEGAVVT